MTLYDNLKKKFQVPNPDLRETGATLAKLKVTVFSAGVVYCGLTIAYA